MTETQARAGAATVGELMTSLGINARAAFRANAASAGADRNRALTEAADALERNVAQVLSANARDLSGAREKRLGAAMLDRLMLDEARVAGMVRGLRDIAARPDPLGAVLAEWERPNGLRIQRVSVPLGVIGIIYESRPNVTADAAALCIKSGNAVILRGGSESFHSSQAIYACMVEGLAAAGLAGDSVQLVPVRDREAVGFLLREMADYVDVIVPRGGKGLIERVQEDARVPVIGHLEGLCHVYLHEDADPRMATDIVLNAKMRRTGICGAAETVLVHEGAADRLLPPVVAALEAAGCEVRGDEAVRTRVDSVLPATELDWRSEYLDAVISIRCVHDLDSAVEHIGRYGSGHTECIVTAADDAATAFFRDVDSAILLHNASTQFADGGEFGMGAEIGIATGRIHARGPVGAEQLTSYKYLVRGQGQVRDG
ncbi:MAG: glutamate-5-semialdehyde dehydrogenase [Pseudomonadota bacterium]